jgi:hypothetical protein
MSLKRKPVWIHVFIILGMIVLATSQTTSTVSADILTLDLYNQKGGQGPNQPSGSFAPGETVELRALLEYNGDPVENKFVGFEVTNSIGEIILIRSNMTDANGIAKINFTVIGECFPDLYGEWSALATSTVSGLFANDTLTFNVTGAFLDLYTQKPEPYSGRGPRKPSDMFARQEEVILYAETHYDCQPIEYKLVAFEVTDPNGTTIIYRTNATDENGIATTRFRLASNATFGTYFAIATVEISGKTAYDTLTFEVGWIIELIEIKTVDQYGNAADIFARGEQIYFNLTAKNMALVSKIATFTVTIYDEHNVPIGLIILHNCVLTPGPAKTFLFNTKIPQWAFIGSGAAFANAYTNLPYLGGVPWYPEQSTMFLIVQL